MENRHTLSFAGYKGETSVYQAAIERFGEAMNARMGERFSLTTFSDEQIHRQWGAEIIKAMDDGELDLCYMATVRFSKFVPQFMLFDLPFISEDGPAFFARLDGALGDFYKGALERTTPYKILTFWDNGLRHITNKSRSLNTLDDCAGLSIRTQLSEVIGDTMRAVGFEARPMEIKAFRKVIDTIDIDGQDNDLPTVYNFGIHKHHPFVSLTGHMRGILMVLCRKEVFDSWPADFRNAVLESLAEASSYQRALCAERDKEAAALMEKDGATVNAIEPDARAAFREAVRPVHAKYRDIFDDPVFDDLF